MRIWLDDERDPNDEDVQKTFPSAKNGPWTWLKTVEDVLHYLNRDEVDFISFDNDLGEGNQEGRVLAGIIEERAFNGSMRPIRWEIHSQNVIGTDSIANAMTNADKFWNRKKASKVNWWIK